MSVQQGCQQPVMSAEKRHYSQISFPSATLFMVSFISGGQEPRSPSAAWETTQALGSAHPPLVPFKSEPLLEIAQISPMIMFHSVIFHISPVVSPPHPVFIWRPSTPSSDPTVPWASLFPPWEVVTVVCVRVQLLSCVRLFVIPWTVARKFHLSMGLPWQEYCRGSHLFLQRIFPIQGSNPHLLWLLHWQVDSFHWATWEASSHYYPHFTEEETEARWMLTSNSHGDFEGEECVMKL